MLQTEDLPLTLNFLTSNFNFRFVFTTTTLFNMLSKMALRRLAQAVVKSSSPSIQQNVHLVRSVTSSSSASSRLATASASSAKKQQHLSSQDIFEREDKYGAHNYHPLPVALAKGKGT